IGYNISILASLGYAKLYRKKYISITFVFIANTIGTQSALSITEEEVKEGHEVVYKKLEDAINEVESYEINNPLSTLTVIALKEVKKYFNNESKK
ncbi:MAG TPA: hypothetical protein VIK86_06955, partial [Candidatus Paceibacterota bacterium]